MATFLQLQDRVRRNIIDLPQSVNAAVPLLVQEAVDELQAAYNFKVMQSTVNLSTVLGQRTLGTLPTAFKEFRGNPYRVESLGRKFDLKVIPGEQQILNAVDSDEMGRPLVLHPSGFSQVNGQMTLDVYPLPDGNSDYNDGEYRITIPIWQRLPVLTGNAAENWFTNQYHGARFIEYSATSNGFAIDWDEERMAMWAQRAQKELRELIKEDKRLIASTVDTLVPLNRGYYQRNLRL